MKRRRFLNAVLTAGIAPYVVRSEGVVIAQANLFAPITGSGLTPGPVPAPVDPTRDVVQLGELAADGPNWQLANRRLVYSWVKPGGDYLDASGVKNGRNHYASTTEPPQVPAGRTATWSLPAALIEALQKQNTGFYLSTTGTIASKFSGRQSATPPALQVVTTTNTFNVPCIANCWVDPSSAGTLPAALPGDPRIAFPAMVKFDLSGITGEVLGGTLTITYTTIYQPGHTIYADYLDMPMLVHDPARQLGGVEQGIASTVSQDSELATHPSVLFYPSFASDPAITASGWDFLGSGGLKQFPLERTQVSWSEYGSTALRFASQYPGFPGDGSSIMTWREFLVGRNELYVRYMLFLDNDVYEGINDTLVSAVKLPGFENARTRGGFSYRYQIGTQSASNPRVFRFHVYAYDGENPLGSAIGEARYTPACLPCSRKVCIEQRVKLNTKNGVTFNSDGILETWVDGVKVYSHTNVKIRTDDATDTVGDFFANVYHGGLGVPRAKMHFELGMVCVATEYIGPPKKGSAPSQPLPYTVPAPGTFKNISLNTLASVQPCPERNCVYYQQGPENIFGAWAGGAYLPSYSTHGALIVHGGGHGAYSGNETYAFNLTTALWERNRTPSPHTESERDSNGEFPDGQPIAVHSYAGVASMPASWYGGTKGKFVRFGFAGDNSVQRAHAINLDNTPNAAWARFTSAPILWVSNLADYNAAARDDTRQGFWVVTAGAGDRTVFIDKNGVITNHMSWNGWHSRVSMAYSPTLDLLVVRGGGTGPSGNGSGIWIKSASTPAAAWTAVNFTGLGPLDIAQGQDGGEASGGACGTEWSSIMAKFVSYPGRGSSKVYILTPGARPFVDPWSWTSETLTGEGGVVPTVTTSNPQNGHWGRFREVPSLKCFVWADSATRSVQLWRPRGMV